MPSKQSLIVKLLGLNIDYHLLLKKIRDLWRPKAMFDLIAMDNEYFLTKFSSVED